MAGGAFVNLVRTGRKVLGWIAAKIVDSFTFCCCLMIVKIPLHSSASAISGE